MTAKEGYIYVLTNPSFPEYVKIGYADNVATRVDQLNRSECTPFAFRVYATLHVANRLADKNIHNIIDKFKPELRAKESVNGKMRVREFFAMSPEDAVDLLKAIGNIYGEELCVYEKTTAEKKDEQIAAKDAVAMERKSPFSFYKCGIQDGEKIVYINDESVVCTVAGDREIEYKGIKTSLSSLAKKLLCKNSAVQGTLYFKYNNEVLSALRKRLEEENRYVIENIESKKGNIAENNKTDTAGTMLFYVQNKYEATCEWNDKTFVLKKGSCISPVVSASCHENINKLREQNAGKISGEFVLTEDISFNSSSAAAAFVSGHSSNGKILWKDKNGILLKDLIK